MEVNIEHVELDFLNNEIAGNIKTFQVKNDIMCFGLKSGLLFFIDLEKPSNVHQHQLPLNKVGPNPERLAKIYLSPDGSLLFIKTNYARYYFANVTALMSDVNDSSNNISKCVLAKKLSKKRSDIRTVHWCSNTSLLLGSENGRLYHIELSDPRKAKNPNWLLMNSDNSLTKLYQFKNCIDGIMWSTENQACLIATGNKILLWRNEHSEKFDPITLFNNNSQAFSQEEFERLHREGGTKFDSLNKTFAWVTRNGIVFQELDNINTSKVLSNSKVILNFELSESNETVKDILVTDYHIITMRRSSISFINQLTNSVEFEESIKLDKNEKILGITSDYSKNEKPTFWCFTSNNIFEIIMKNESKSVWKILCKQKKFNKASKLKGLSDLERSSIYLQKGEYYYEKGDISLAADAFANSKAVPVGKIALRLIKDEKNLRPLQNYLIKKLDSFDTSNQIQRIILSSWIIWNFLKLLDNFEERSGSELDLELLNQLNNKREILLQTIKEFLHNHLDCFDKPTISQILSKHRDKSLYLYFETLTENYSKVLSFLIHKGDWYEALKILQKIKNPEITYTYSTVLMLNVPESTINTWMQLDDIDPKKLIPALLSYFTNFQKQRTIVKKQTAKDDPNYAIQYLKWYITEHDPRDKLIYNTVLYLLISEIGTKIRANSEVTDTIIIEEEKVVDFLKIYDGQYDLDFILRLAMKYKCSKIVIYIYTKLNLYEEAVNFALENNMIEEAKFVTNNTESLDPIVAKELWLKIARVMLYEKDGNHDVKNTIKIIIMESREVITIKDLLPLFNQFTTIANLKEELTKSLEGYGQSMAQTLADIKQSMKMKTTIKDDIKHFNERYAMLEPGVSCSHCKSILQTRKFFVFPCEHCFHTDCLIKLILESNDYTLKNKIQNFQAKYSKNDKQSVDLEEFEAILAAKCVLCSEIHINAIDDPISINEEESEKWAL